MALRTKSNDGVERLENGSTELNDLCRRNIQQAQARQGKDLTRKQLVQKLTR